MRGDEVAQAAEAAKEGAKAVQEVAKAATAGIEATEKLGGFVSRIVGEPVDAMIGILTDRLKYTRWERQRRLTQRAKELIKGEEIDGPLRIVPLKIALPIIENASLEEDDELQDLWAQLITSAVNPNFEGEIRSAFGEIIKQLEVNDAHILKLVYSRYERWKSGDEAVLQEDGVPSLDRYGGFVDSYAALARPSTVEHPELPTSQRFITGKLQISETAYKESIDNLIRVRCITPFVAVRNIEIPRKVQGDMFGRQRTTIGGRPMLSTELQQVTLTHGHDAVCITSLGIAFANACMHQR